MKRSGHKIDVVDFARLISDIKRELDGFSEESPVIRKRIKHIKQKLEQFELTNNSAKNDAGSAISENTATGSGTFSNYLNLVKSNDDFHLQFENSLDSIWTINPNFEIILANTNFKEKYKENFGIQPEKGNNILENVPGSLKKLWKTRYQKALKGNSETYIDTLSLRGKQIFTETILHPIIVQGEITGVSCTARNITEQKQFEAALSESETRYKTLLSNIPLIIYRCKNDSDWTMEFISDEIETISGYPASDFICNTKRSYASIIHPTDRIFVENTVKNGLLLHEHFEMEYRIVHADGKVCWVFESGKGQFDSENKVLWLDGYIENITSRKSTEEALQQSEEKYRHIFDSMSDVYLQVDKKGIIQIISPSVRNVLGFQPDSLVEKELATILKFPVDKVVLLDKILKKKFVAEQELLFLNSEKEERTISLNARLLFDKSGIAGGFEGTFRDITLRKIAEQSLRERTNELNSIFDNVPLVLILADEFGNILNVNKGLVRVGKTSPQIMQKLTAEVLKCIFAVRTIQGCGKGSSCKTCKIKHAFTKTLESGKGLHQLEGKIEIEHEGKTIYRDILLSTTFIHFDNSNRVLLSLDDITEMKEAQSQIRKLSAAIEQSPVTIVITDTDGTIQYANPQFTKTTGYTLEEAIGQNPRILRSPKNPDSLYKQLWTTILSGNIWQGEFFNVKKDGTEYWENAVISPIIDSDGRIISYVAIKEDITERKAIQEKLILSERELRQMNDEKSKYFSILAHDLRGLLGSFYSFSDLLFTEFENFEQAELKDQLKQLSKLSYDSLVLLDNLLEWARASLGNIKFNFEQISLNSEVNQVLSYLSDMARAKGIELNNHIQSDFSVYTDSNVLKTIIRNLINNAVKFTMPGGKISITAEHCENGSVEISVRDTGVGIEASILKKLFKAGEKTVRDGTNNEKGTGLGLMICHEMVTRLGGTIHVESQVGKGSRFFIRLPLEKP